MRFNMQASKPPIENISMRLKSARLRARLTQAELAKAIGADQTTICRIENGQKPRNRLLKPLLGFIKEHETSGMKSVEDILQIVKTSDELRALVSSIIYESNA